MKKRMVVLIAVGFLFLMSLYVLREGATKKDRNDSRDFNETTFSRDIVMDGNHHKINYPIILKDEEVYLSLDDLEQLLPLNIIKKGNNVHIQYENEHVDYVEGTLQNKGKKEEDTQKYLQKNNTIYLPKSHLERFLGLRITHFYDEKTKTIAIQTPKEQQKATFNQTIGSTIFVHKKGVPLEKYEPRNGLYVGSYVLQDEFIDLSMEKFNELSNKQHASYFKYVGYGKPFPTEWVEDVKQAGGFPHIAWEPNDGLDIVKDDAYLRTFAQDAKKSGVPVLLRYASEMNGTWTFYSGNEDLYIEKWKIVHDVMAEEAPNVLMLWNVFTIPEGSIDNFYPGDDYVDYVGVNLYNVMYHNDNLANQSDFEDPLRLLDYVYNTYSDQKPIVIGEYGATNYTITDGLFHTDFAIEKISRVYQYLPTLYPRVKMIYYFDVNNLVNAPEGRKINNYAITEDERIMEAYKTAIHHPRYLSAIDEANSTSEKAEIFSYRDFFFLYQRTLYVDEQFVREYLNLDVTKVNETNQYTISNKTKESKPLTVQAEVHVIDKAAYFEKRTLTGLPIVQILEYFGISYELKNGDLYIEM